MGGRYSGMVPVVLQSSSQFIGEVEIGQVWVGSTALVGGSHVGSRGITPACDIIILSLCLMGKALSLGAGEKSAV